MRYFVIASFVALLWAVGPVFQKYAMNRGVHPYAVITLSSVAYVACVVPFALWNRAEVSEGLSRLDRMSAVAVVIASISTAFLANVLFLTVLRENPTAITTAITFASPLFTCLIAWALLGETLTLAKIAGISLIVTGVILVAS